MTTLIGSCWVSAEGAASLHVGTPHILSLAPLLGSLELIDEAGGIDVIPLPTRERLSVEREVPAAAAVIIEGVLRHAVAVLIGGGEQ